MKENSLILSQEQMAKNEMIQMHYGMASNENPILMHGTVERTLLGTQGEKMYIDVCDDFGIHHIIEDNTEGLVIGERKTYVVSGLCTRSNGVLGCICKEYTTTNFFNIYGPQSSEVAYKRSAVVEKDDQLPEKLCWLSVVQVIAGMANASGGTIYVGVRRDGSIRGIEKDYPYLPNMKIGLYSTDRNGWNRYLQDLITICLSSNIWNCINISYHTFVEGTVCTIKITPSKEPIWVDKHLFCVRELTKTKFVRNNDILMYCCLHFPDYIRSIMTAANEIHSTSANTQPIVPDSSLTTEENSTIPHIASIPRNRYINFFSHGEWNWTYGKKDNAPDLITSIEVDESSNNNLIAFIFDNGRVQVVEKQTYLDKCSNRRYHNGYNVDAGLVSIQETSKDSSVLFKLCVDKQSRSWAYIYPIDAITPHPTMHAKGNKIIDMRGVTIEGATVITQEDAAKLESYTYKSKGCAGKEIKDLDLQFIDQLTHIDTINLSNVG